MARKIPKYYGFRIYFTATLLYFFLVIPFLLFMIALQIPEIAEKKGWMNDDVQANVDSLAVLADSLALEGEEFLEPLIGSAIEVGEQMEELEEKAEQEKGRVKTTRPGVVQVEVDKDEGSQRLFEDKGAMNRFFNLLFFFTLGSYAIGLAYNLNFRQYFLRLRRKKRKEIPDKMLSYCRKHLLRTSLINGIIVSSPGILALLYSLVVIIIPGDLEGALEKETFLEFFYLATLATLLEFLFVFYWQKHRVQNLYIDHVFSPEDLRQRIRPRKGGKIRDRLVIASIMTTFLPLLIVFAYLVKSLTRIRAVDSALLTSESWQILIGPWGNLIGDGAESLSLDKVGWMVYVNAADTLSMIVGIVAGILVSLLYLLLFIRWTNQDLTKPLKELLVQMANTRGGDVEQYVPVRTNDEIGELAEGYNAMTKQIHEHMEHIFALNRDLEQKVEDRTQEVVMQKEEIEAQKEEIEAQLDLATSQRDTISQQKDQILDSIQYAEKIQSALLPPEMFLKDVLKEHFVLYMPRDIVSGDFYWSAFTEGKLLIAAADCTGHGVPGAFLSVMGISSLNEILNRSEGVPRASQILSSLRDYVIHSLHQKGERGEANDGIEIALCIIDPQRRELEFAGANRPLYLLRKSGEFEIVKGDRMPIGIYDEEHGSFTDHNLKLEKGDTLYMFSDGYVDQLGGPLRKTYRAIHFRKLLLEISTEAMDVQARKLKERHYAWRGDVEQIDDILVLGLRL